MIESHVLVARRLRENARLLGHFGRTAGPAIARAAELLIGALRRGGKVLLFGNGGSAGDAMHIAAELVNRFERERGGMAALALTVDPCVLTSIANDSGYREVFARQLRALARPEDVVVAITTSGRSPNVRHAIAVARELGVAVVGLTGAAGSEFASLCDAAVVVPSLRTARIQECHLIIGHLLCEIAEETLFPGAPESASMEEHDDSKESDLDSLVHARRTWREAGLTVVWTNGAFDLLHAGHVKSLRAARELGDVLIVGVNSDAQVRRLKGEERPVYPAAERVALLSALAVVDRVVVFDDPTPERILAALQPDIHCKGAEYEGRAIPERTVVEAYGGRVALLPMIPGLSTTAVLGGRRA